MTLYLIENTLKNADVFFALDIQTKTRSRLRAVKSHEQNEQNK